MSEQTAWINGTWQSAQGEQLQSLNPATGQTLWSGSTATTENVDQAFGAARDAFPSWRRTPLEDRARLCEQFAERIRDSETEYAELISNETGKPLWEAKTEVAAVIGKVGLAYSAIKERRWRQEFEFGDGQAVTRYKPHGVLGVLGPFNFPAHLPNGHIVPALLAGNTIVFKPSELTPNVGDFMIRCWAETDLPPGVLNLVQGGRTAGQAIVEHSQLDGVLFTGSSQTGKHFLKAFAEHPGKMLALEMGGNNPLIVHDVADLKAAAYLTLLSAFLTSGQRCTCARRLILVENESTQSFLNLLTSLIKNLSCGLPTDRPEPFLGPLVSAQNAEMILRAQQKLIDQGGLSLVEAYLDSRSTALVHPGVIDVTSLQSRNDEEWFGPLLQVIRVPTFEAALVEANRTTFGLSAGLISDSRNCYEEFLDGIRAGIVNWNRQTTGASGKLPFGGTGESGNHRPSGYFAADYCSYPVASIESEHPTLPETLLPGIRFPE